MINRAAWLEVNNFLVCHYPSFEKYLTPYELIIKVDQTSSNTVCTYQEQNNSKNGRTTCSKKKKTNNKRT